MSKAAAESLTPKEIQLLAAAWMSYDVQPKPNYEKIANICGYKNAGVASVMFGQVRRKLVGSTPAKKTSPKKRASDDEVAASDESPTKKRASAAKRAKKAGSDEKVAANNHSSEQGGAKIKVEAAGEEDDDNDVSDLDSVLYPTGSYGVF